MHRRTRSPTGKARFGTDRRGRRTIAQAILRGLVLMALSVAGPAHAADPTQDAASVLGRWETREHDGVFEIGRCGDALCGRLVGMRYTGEVPKAKDGGSECGLLMLTGFVPDTDDAGRWNGHILDPDTGKVYHAQIWSPSQGVLKLRGYVGIPLFGETHTWTRYAGTIGAICQMP